MPDGKQGSSSFADGKNGSMTSSALIGKSVLHRSYVGFGDTRYGGGLVDGSFVMRLFGDAATELCIRTDGDEGLFASYEDVQFIKPVRAGDVIEVEAQIIDAGVRSRKLQLLARVVCRSAPERGLSASIVLQQPLVVATARGTVVVAGTRDASAIAADA